MGLHFRKRLSLKLTKFFKVNFNKKSKSVTVGGKKVKVTVNDKNKITASLPGTGVSYDTTLGKGKKKKSSGK
ncbi:MAG: DUF4236 domain-containing protein [Ruminococcus sp.]|nr:DUF4236 domain-containing protein [Ruminococcus sp.]